MFEPDKTEEIQQSDKRDRRENRGTEKKKKRVRNSPVGHDDGVGIEEMERKKRGIKDKM